jgi:serine/threonine protein kinase
MTSDRWERLKDLFEAALEHAPAERGAYVSRVCSSDQDLQQELEYLLDQHEQIGDFLEPAEQKHLSQIFSSGQLVADRFRILSFVGRGGMGEVYEAEDQDLKERIALKTIRPELAADQRSVRRLIQEIQSARRVTDPHVCRVHDLARHQTGQEEVIFLTMEFVAGETLAEHLRRYGPFEKTEALGLVKHICQALDAIHAAGIIHRDFKTANVMLRADEHGRFNAIVTDFGLARDNAGVAERSLTEQGLLMGTPAYMAPELLAGNPASPASDIYALGVVFCELISGNKPSSVPAGVDERWMTTIRKCLEPNPQARFASASAVYRSLAGEHSTEVRGSASKLARPAILAGVLFIVALSILAFRFYNREPKAAKGATFLVTTVLNTTQDRDLEGINEMLRAELSQSSYFNLWNPGRLPEVLRNMGREPGQSLDAKTAREVALREGVPLVLFGNLSQLGDSLVLNLRLEELGTHTVFSRNAWTYSTTAASKNLLPEAVHQATRWLRSLIGETAGELAAADRLPQDITTSSWEALAFYADAERAKAQSDSTKAIAFLKDALRKDPEFALAYMRLGDILMSLGRRREGLENWQLAVAKAKQGRLSRREEMRIRGSYAGDIKDYPAEEAAFTEMKAEYPYDYLASFYLANALRWQNRLGESVSNLTDAVHLMPSVSAIHTNLAGDYLLLQHAAEAEKEIAQLRSMGLGDQAAHYEGLLLFQQDDGAGAEKAFMEEKSSKDIAASSRGAAFLAALFAEQSRYLEAIDELTAAIKRDEEDGRSDAAADKRTSLAAIQFKLGNLAAARRLCLEAEQADLNPERLRRLGTILARAGLVEDAERIARSIQGFLPDARVSKVAESHVRCEILAAQHKYPDALACAQQLSSIEPPLRPRAYLARAYAAAGRVDESLVYFDQVTRSPQLLWQTVDFDYPGYLADALLDEARVQYRAGHKQTSLDAVRLYIKKENRADPGLPDIKDANRLLQVLTASTSN